MNDEHFAHLFSSFSSDPQVPANGISRGLVGKIFRDFHNKCARVVDRIIFFQILAKRRKKFAFTQCTDASNVLAIFKFL